MKSDGKMRAMIIITINLVFPNAIQNSNYNAEQQPSSLSLSLSLSLSIIEK